MDAAKGAFAKLEAEFNSLRPNSGEGIIFSRLESTLNMLSTGESAQAPDDDSTAHMVIDPAAQG